MIRYIPFSDEMSEETPSILCLGNFDGVHRGHLALIEQAKKIRAHLSLSGQNARIGVLCFDILSSDHFSKNGVPHLMTLEKKLNVIKRMGVDCAYVCDFAKIKELSPTEFIEEILIKKCSCIGAVCGFNFKFGKNAVGNAELLCDYFYKKLGSRDTCGIVPPVMLDDKIISSSHIRELISKGKIEDANAMSGHIFSIFHKVVHGKHLGTQLGFPTLNHIFSSDEIIPAFGIYATKTVIDRESFLSVTNVGVRPTVSCSDTVTCETHIIGIENETKSFYGQDAEIFFYSKLRNEKRFSSHEELSKAIAADVEATKIYFLSKNEIINE